MEKHKVILTGILSILLVFGLVLAGCDTGTNLNGSEYTNGNNTGGNDTGGNNTRDNNTGGNNISVPSAPSALGAAATSPSSITISWSPVSTATSYEIYYARLSSTENYVGTTSSISYIHNGLSSGTTYYYYIKAVNSAGSSSYSPRANATTWYSPYALQQSAGILGDEGTHDRRRSPGAGR